MNSILTKSGYSIKPFIGVIFMITVTFIFLLSSVSCHSNKSDTITPQTTTGTGDFFSKCTVSNYQCSGDKSTCFTILAPDPKGGDEYGFYLGMIVDNNSYQQLAVVISLSSFSGKGVYNLTSANTDISYIIRPAITGYQSSKLQGTLEITDYQVKKYIQGKFTINSSAGTRELDMKDGTFKVEADF